MQYIHSWSGGKDSTAAIILNHICNLPPATIIFSEVMYDKKRGISGELPIHIDFIKNKAIPTFKSWGYDVKILHDDKDYLDCFHHIIEKSSIPSRIGKKNGFPIAGMCSVNNRIKIRAIRQFRKTLTDDYIEYVGIAIDEPLRLAKLEGTNKKSLLAEYNYTEAMAYSLCEKYDLLSPIYNHMCRGGCWFCPNASYSEFAYLKLHHPELWNELKELSMDDNLVSKKFRYGKTFAEVELKVDEFIKNMK